MVGREPPASLASVISAVQRVEQVRSLAAYTSTQEQAWLGLAARALSKDSAAMSVDANGEPRKGSLYRNLKANELERAFRVTNTGENPVQAVVSSARCCSVASSLT